MASVDERLWAAAAGGATDWHLDPRPDGAIVRWRVDGLLRVVERLDAPAAAALSDALRARLGEGGRCRLETGEQRLEVRGAPAPTIHGPRWCLRLVTPERTLLAWDELFWQPAAAAAARRLIERASGLLVIAGPADSGREAVAATLLAALAGETINAASVEDPLEFELDWVAQAAVDARAGQTAPALLRGLAAQDADVILLNAPADPETVGLSLELANSGRLVLLSVQAPNGLAAAQAWLEQGVNPYALGQAFAGALGLRRARAVCLACATEVPPSAASAMMALGLDGELDLVPAGAGCAACAGTGLAGWVPLVEVIEATQALRDALGRAAPAEVLDELAYSPQLPPLREQAAAAVRRGLCTPEGAYRALVTY